MRLFIAEKPTVANAIAAELGSGKKANGYIECGSARVTWCFGHMLEQAEPDEYLSADIPVSAKTGKKPWRQEDLPIIPQQWILRPKDDAKAQLKIIGALLKVATEVVNAGDPDREGQLLVDEVLEHFGCSVPVKRFWVQSQDSTSIRRGLDALKSNSEYERFGRAAQARSKADWLIGMNLTRAYTLRAQSAGGQALLTVGRVQTPTLGLVVARDREIESFKSVPYYTIQAAFQHAGGSFVAEWKPKEEQAGLDEQGRLLDAGVAAAIAAAATGQGATVESYSQEPKRKFHPKAFALSDLTLIASNKFGYTGMQTLDACQALYETHKLTSYPRTDCAFLPEVQHGDAPSVLAAIKHTNPELAGLVDGADPSIKSKTWNDAEITAHHGIIPTMHKGSTATLSPVEKNIYDLVVRAYLAQFYPIHEYMQTAIAVQCAGELFAVTGNTVTKEGWQAVYSESTEAADTKPEATAMQRLPQTSVGDSLQCVRAIRKDSKTKPPSRYTDGTLGNAMVNIHKHVTDPAHKKMLKERDGLGTEATRATIIADLKRRGFLAAQGKFLISTASGRALIDALPAAIKSPVLTAIHERVLKEIELGQADCAAFLVQQEQFIRDQVAKAANASTAGFAADAPRCPACDGGHLRRIKGPRGAFFWGCSAFNSGCKYSCSDDKGKPTLADPKSISELHKCMTCGLGLVRRASTKTNGAYWWACSGFPNCRQTYPDAAGKPNYQQTAGAKS